MLMMLIAFGKISLINFQLEFLPVLSQRREKFIVNLTDVLPLSRKILHRLRSSILPNILAFVIVKEFQ
jgi:hypothetical protein